MNKQKKKKIEIHITLKKKNLEGYLRMRLSNLHQNQRRMCTLWVCHFLFTCIVEELSKCQVSQCCNFVLVKRRESDRYRVI